MQKEKWVEIRKGADFLAISKKYGIDPVTARIIRNRGMVTDAQIKDYLNPDLARLYSPHLMKDMDVLTKILQEKIQSKKQIRIIGDYDIDGISSTYILLKGIQRAGGRVTAAIPDRIRDGYGINKNLITQAKEDGADTIITCDNGIAAIDAIAYAKELGLTVLVTDHHDIPYIEENGVRIYQRSSADAIVNPKQAECSYPYAGICGAAVAFKVIQALYEACGIPLEESLAFLENVAFATVCDVMDLTDENRIFVKFGLEEMRSTKNKGLLALIRQKNILPEKIDAYHLGFVLGPCLNASGRLDQAMRSLNLMLAESEVDAAVRAIELSDLNEERKYLTDDGMKAAQELILEKRLDLKKVIVLYLPMLHESVAGIVAGNIKEQYNHPVFVLTDSTDGIKGSGRSIEAYSMYDELCKCQDLFLKFGGHPMAAGFTLLTKNVDEFEKRLNQNSVLTEEDFIPKVQIDVPMPLGYVTEHLIEEFALLEPFGKGNKRPVFADRKIKVKTKQIVGKKQNVLKMTLEDQAGQCYPAVYFGNVREFFDFLEEKNTISIVYYPKIDTYMGKCEIQFVITNYC